MPQRARPLKASLLSQTSTQLKKTMKKIITLIVAYLCLSVSHAQAQNAPTSQQVTLHVATAGTLPDMIDPSRRPYITNLKLTGELNGTDIRLVREMAGADIYGNPTQGALEHLDLSEAEIVNGGETYYIDVDTAFFFLTRTITINTYYTNKHIYDDGSRRYEDSNTGFDCLLAACHKLKSVKLPPRHTWGSVFNNCTGLTSVDIPEGVMDLSSTFWGCTSLTSIDIPEGVTNLSSTFYGCCTSLTSVNIPEGVTNQ